ncbi:hypothetical protein WA158_004556 [Blastocystis sp. Blastoise]
MSESEDDEPIVSRSIDQRWPLPDEPVCKICGRYGAYVCDETDEDVCSLQCKSKSIENNKKKSQSEEKIAVIPLDASLNTNKNMNNPEKNKKNDATIQSQSPYPFYIESQETKSISISQRDLLRQKLGITVKSQIELSPISQFEFCGYSTTLINNIKQAGYLHPTPIQMQAIPYIQASITAVISSPTGSGKSAAYLFPLVHICSSLSSSCPPSVACSHPYALIVTPSRELCIQIENTIKIISKGLFRMRTCLLVGGIPIQTQIHRLKQDITIVIATPGRLLDLLKNQDSRDYLESVSSQSIYKEDEVSPVLFLDELCIYSIDEGDMMAKGGFDRQLNDIESFIKHTVQKVIITATITSNLSEYIAKTIINPSFITVKSDLSMNPIIESFYWVEEANKRIKLLNFLTDKDFIHFPVLIFVATKLDCIELYNYLKENLNYSMNCIHVDIPQSQRINITSDFIQGNIDILVLTGILGRGVDLQRVQTVIHYDFPLSLSEYTHQRGRAGRLGEKGYSIAFINNKCQKVFGGLYKLMEERNIKKPKEQISIPILQEKELFSYQSQQDWKQFLSSRK